MAQETVPEDTRVRLLAAARVVIVRDGIQRARMEDIAAEAGVSRAAVYYHFRSKNDLAAALIDDVMRDQLELVRATLTSGGIEQVIPTCVRFFTEQAALARLLILEAPVNPVHLLARHRVGLLSLLRDRLRRDMDAGLIRQCDPDMAAEAIAGIMRVPPLRLAVETATDVDHMTSELTTFVRYALAPPTPAPTPLDEPT